MTDAVLAVDVGGTTLTGGMVTENGDVLWALETATVSTDRGRDPGLHQLTELVQRLRHEATNRGQAVRAVSVGFPEYVNHNGVTSSEVIAWDRQPIDVLRENLDGVPVFVESDVRCAAMAEARITATGERDMFYVSWGTGLSSTLVVGEVCRAGRRGEAIALGEFDVPAIVEPTWTANLEQFASGTGIAKRYAAAHPESKLDSRAVAALADDGDREAIAIVDSAARAVAAALRSCIAILDPDIVVLGGGIGTADGVLAATARTELDRLLSRADPPAIRPTQLGARAGLIGAGLTGWLRTTAQRTGDRTVANPSRTSDT